MVAQEQYMQAIAISAFGGPDRLTLVNLPVPTCDPDQVIVHVQAAGVGMWDVKVRQLLKRVEKQLREESGGLHHERDQRVARQSQPTRGR